MVVSIDKTLKIEDSIKELFKRELSQGYKLASLHPYHDQSGVILFYRPRLTHKTKEKIIRPVHKDNNGQLKFGEPDYLKEDGQLKPIYNLHLLNTYPKAKVFVVEGEGVADQLNSCLSDWNVQSEYIATTSGGAISSERADWSPLNGRKCVVWGDNDEPGRNYVTSLMSKLSQQQCDYEVVDTDRLGLDEGGDFVDWHEQNPQVNINDLLNLPMALVDELYHDKTGLVGLTVEELLNLDIKPREYLLSPWLPSSGVCMVHAYRGVGKTFFALEVAVAVASGGSFLGFKAPMPRSVLFIDGEMPAVVMQERLKEILSRVECEAKGLQLKILTPDLYDDFMPNLSTAEGQEVVEALVQEADLIIVDNIATLCSHGKENEIDSWRPMQAWTLKLRKLGKTILFIHHSGKSGKQRGTSGREDIQDTVIHLKHPSDYESSLGACFELHFEKHRGFYGDDALPLRCQLTDTEWKFTTIELGGNYQKVVELIKGGLKQSEIAEELQLTAGYVSKLVKRAKENGDLK